MEVIIQVVHLGGILPLTKNCQVGLLTVIPAERDAMTSYLERKYGKILKSMKAEIEAFEGSQQLTVKVKFVVTCACGHKEFRYATAAEILAHKDEILASDDHCLSEKEFYLRVNSAEICSDCKEQLTFRAKYRPDSTIQNLTFSHGLAAFSEAEGNYEKMIKNFDGIVNHPNWEICVSSESTHLGGIGIACSGEVSLAATTDVFSYATKGYRRCDVEEYAKYFVTTSADLTPSADGCGYIEVWVKPQTIKYIWIKEKYGFKDEAIQYFTDLGYEVKIVA